MKSFKTFRQHINEVQVPKSKDPPLYLQLRRQAIRNFPNGERVALYSSSQLGVSVAVPYDTASGDLKPALNIKENFDEPRFGDYLHHLATNDTAAQKTIEQHVKASGKSFEHFHKAALAYHEGDMNSANRHLRKYMKEDVDCNKADELNSAYDVLSNKKEHSDLDRALFNWLSSELDEYGPFDEMDDDVLDDVYDDYKALTSEANVSEGVSRFGNNSPIVRALNNKVAPKSSSKSALAPKKMKGPTTHTSFADWHDHAERKGGTEVQFKIHNAGDSTSAFHHGKKLGTFSHKTNTGSIEESIIHHVNRIVNTGQEDEVKFANGETARLHPVTAKAIQDLYNKVNDGNQRKISAMINSGMSGMNKIADFAMTALKRGNN